MQIQNNLKSYLKNKTFEFWIIKLEASFSGKGALLQI